MALGYRNQMLVFALVSIGIVMLDQLTKQIVIAHIPIGGMVEIVPGFFNVVHTRNPGAAFGLLAGFESAYRWWFFVGISTIVVTVLMVMMLAYPGMSNLLVVGYGCFMGGALGNLVDRIRFGAVVDFLDVYREPFHWPAFNVADAALCLGTGLFLLVMTASPGSEKR